MDFQETVVIPHQFATDASVASPTWQGRLFSRTSTDFSADESRRGERSFLPLHSERIQGQIHRIEPIQRTIGVHHRAHRTGLDAIIGPADDPNSLERCGQKRNQVPVDQRDAEIRFAAQMIRSRLRRPEFGRCGSQNRMFAGTEFPTLVLAVDPNRRP